MQWREKAAAQIDNEAKEQSARLAADASKRKIAETFNSALHVVGLEW
jgi:hypothetical protein